MSYGVMGGYFMHLRTDLEGLFKHVTNGEIEETKQILDGDKEKALYADDLIAVWSALHDAKRLNSENFNILYQHAQYAKILCPDYLDIFCQYAKDPDLLYALASLQDAKLLNTGNGNVDMLFRNIQYLNNIACGLNFLKKAGILEQKNFELLCEHVQNDDFLLVLSELHKTKIVKDCFKTLCQHARYAKKLAYGAEVLSEAGILDPTHFDFLCRYIQDSDFFFVLSMLHKAGIVKSGFSLLCQQVTRVKNLADGLDLLQEAGVTLNQTYFSLFCENSAHLPFLLREMVVLKDAGILDQNNFELLCKPFQKQPLYVCNFGNVLCMLHESGFLRALKDNIQNKHLLEELLMFFQYAKLDKIAYLDLMKHKTPEDIYHHIIYSDDTKKFNKYVKIAAFFLVYHETLEKVFSSEQKINEIKQAISEMQPPSVRNDLKNILHKLGGYSFMPDDEKNITLGVEIEYSNVPSDFKGLTEFVMGSIQQGWRHPGDASVIPRGKNTYSGETTTPIIAENKELIPAMLNVAFLQAMGAEANQSCGLHVHIGVRNIEIPKEYKVVTIEDKYQSDANHQLDFTYNNYQLEFIKQFLMIYKREADKFISMEREKNKFIETVILPDEKEMRSISTLSNLIWRVNRGTRYYEINLHAFLLHGTIEVRRFSGTTEEPQIYATVAMIAAMAREAKKRTNQIFQVQMVPEEKRRMDEKFKLACNQSFLGRVQTERQTELWMLRVNPLNESFLTTKKPSIKKNVVYVYLNPQNGICYKFYDKEGKKIKGVIENDKRFEKIIEQLKSHKGLSAREKNQILYEVAMHSHANVSHRVEKFKSTDLSSELEAKLKARR